MEIQEFTDKHPYVYHLTDKRNYNNIITSKKLYSATYLIGKSTLSKEKKLELNSERRPEHTIVTIGNKKHFIRDQRPISVRVLSRSLTNGWSYQEFIQHLNKRVFLWPTEKRLRIHFARYKDEKPIILRFKTSDILNLHPDAEFSRLNSGATRCSSHWGGNAPERGIETFLPAPKYNLPSSTVAEVTVVNSCKLPNSFEIAYSPDGPWKAVKI